VFASGPALNTPFDVVVGTDGDVFVANAGGLNTIARLDPTTGAVINPSFTSGNVTPIGGPQYLEFGPALALTDIAGRLFRFNPVSGVHVSTSLGFSNPEGVAYAPNGDLYVATFMEIYRLPGGIFPAELVVDGINFPTDIEFGPDGTLYVLSDQIYRYDVSGPTGLLVDSFGTSGGEFLVFYTPIPEPGTAWLLGGSLVAAAALRLRKRG
jgi:DNA-binding beta-propeller fold protein YncE